MKKLYLLLLTLLFIQCGIAQSNKSSTSNFQILIESLPDASGKPSELSFDLENSGTYTFKLSESLSVPEGYQAIIEDKMSGNIFNLESNRQHTFSVSRAMTKQFVFSLRKKEIVTSG